ncbi:hypothetical protein UPYG_G00034630 [Umbra pygmaea]|uniref:Uncharacterized protein n=1 Tax=Umbra pygmaea TaxID=75934 RepID=A0ABD0YAJ9_UMBPY
MREDETFPDDLKSWREQGEWAEWIHVCLSLPGSVRPDLRPGLPHQWRGRVTSPCKGMCAWLWELACPGPATGALIQVLLLTVSVFVPRSWRTVATNSRKSWGRQGETQLRSPVEYE